MNVTVAISNDCGQHWVPSQQQCEQWLNCGLEAAGHGEQCSISVSFIDSAASRALNNDYRGNDKPTNVLSFPADFPVQLRDQVEAFPLGDIVICAAIVELEAKAQSKELLAHWMHLTVHGLFHLLGYQHDDDANAAEMEKLEINTLERLGISNPYLLV